MSASSVMRFDPDVAAADFAGRRVTIIGLGKGRTTVGLARFLVDAGAAVTVCDAKPASQLAEGLARIAGVPVDLRLAASTDDDALAGADFVFVVPGVRPRSGTVLRALQRGIPILTEIGLFFRLCPAPIVGITGTKGKSTTTTLVSRMLARGSRRVVTGGNIGTAVIQELPTLTADDVVVLELSSFQLETLGQSPHIAVVTNVYEDHLDHHGTRDAYVQAKANILRWQRAGDIAVLNLDDPASLALHDGAPSEVRGFSLRNRPARGACLDERDRLVLFEGGRSVELCALGDLRVAGRHNAANGLAAAIVAAEYGVPVAAITDVLRAFEGLPHRLEPVAEVRGVLWVNDSQGTTPYATIPALAAFDRPVIVILGGVGKGADFGELGRQVAAHARAAVLIGQAADEIEAAILAARTGGPTVQVSRARSLADAVDRARSLALPGDVVLLSPACASFDMYASFEERGDDFRRLVAELAA